MNGLTVSVLLLASVVFVTVNTKSFCGSYYKDLVCRTRSTYPGRDSSHTAAKAGCQRYRGHLCTMDELVTAYQAGYRDTTWAIVDFPGGARDTKLTPCRRDYVEDRPNGCYYVPYIGFKPSVKDSFLPLTPGPGSSSTAYCCK